jgi:hypothetical protein
MIYNVVYLLTVAWCHPLPRPRTPHNPPPHSHSSSCWILVGWWLLFVVVGVAEGQWGFKKKSQIPYRMPMRSDAKRTRNDEAHRQMST